MNKPLRIFSINSLLIRFFANIIGKSSDVERLINSFQIDISHTKQILNWTPPFSIDNGIKKMVDDFKFRYLNDKSY